MGIVCGEHDAWGADAVTSRPYPGSGLVDITPPPHRQDLTRHTHAKTALFYAAGLRTIKKAQEVGSMQPLTLLPGQTVTCSFYSSEKSHGLKPIRTEKSVHAHKSS